LSRGKGSPIRNLRPRNLGDEGILAAVLAAMKPVPLTWTVVPAGGSRRKLTSLAMRQIPSNDDFARAPFRLSSAVNHYGQYRVGWMFGQREINIMTSMPSRYRPCWLQKVQQTIFAWTGAYSLKPVHGCKRCCGTVGARSRFRQRRISNRGGSCLAVPHGPRRAARVMWVIPAHLASPGGPRKPAEPPS